MNEVCWKKTTGMDTESFEKKKLHLAETAKSTFKKIHKTYWTNLVI